MGGGPSVSVLILPGEEEFYAEYGKDYWLDHLPDLPPATRTACIQKYKYKRSDLAKQGSTMMALDPPQLRPFSLSYVQVTQVRFDTTSSLTKKQIAY